MSSENKIVNFRKEINDDNNLGTKMRIALTSIAHEMQSFHIATDTAKVNYCQNEDILDKLYTLRYNLKSKRKQIKKLNGNLKAVCIIAKTLMSARESETLIYHNQVNLVNNKSADLVEKNTQYLQNIQKITTENEVLNDKLDNLSGFIDLGYKELQKMRNEPIEESSVMRKLMQIMNSCGEYYANYHNEHEKCLRLEQKHRFLNNKLNILQNNLDVLNEELNHNRCQERTRKDRRIVADLKVKKFPTRVTNRPLTLDNSSTVHCDSDTKLKPKSIKYVHSQIINQDHSSVRFRIKKLKHDFNFHLSGVKNLLRDQSNMLQNLKKLSEELNILP